MTEEIPVFLQVLTLLLIITGPVTLLVVLGVAILSALNLGQRRWEQGVAVLVGVGVVAILILTPVAWRSAPWALIT